METLTGDRVISKQPHLDHLPARLQGPPLLLHYTTIPLLVLRTQTYQHHRFQKVSGITTEPLSGSITPTKTRAS
jgi:hypothetical protein